MIPKFQPDLILIQNSASAHTANRTKQLLEDNAITVRTQSAKSADLDLIELIWSILKTHIEKEILRCN